MLYGIDVTIDDPEPPVPTVSAEGLLAGGPRNGSDPVVLGATDNAGIRRVELHDVTVPGAPQLVGAEDYTAAQTDAGATCSARLAKTCPDLARESVRPTACRSAGASCSCARSTRAATPPTAGPTRSTSSPPRTAARSTAPARRRRAR